MRESPVTCRRLARGLPGFSLLHAPNLGAPTARPLKPQVNRHKHEQLMRVHDAMVAGLAGGGGGGGGGAAAGAPPGGGGGAAPGAEGAGAAAPPGGGGGRRGGGARGGASEDEHMPAVGPAAPLHADPSAAGATSGAASASDGRQRSDSGEQQLVPLGTPGGGALTVAALVTSLGAPRAPAAVAAAEAEAALQGEATSGGGDDGGGGEAEGDLELQPLNFPLPSQVGLPGLGGS
jgi:hypothetical protein